MPDDTQAIRWLDLGCHDGTLARLLAAQGYRVTGVDVYDPALKQESSWEYVQFNLDKVPLPFAADSFNIVSALELIEHIIDTDTFLEEVKRIVRAGGLFVLSTPNICMAKNRLRVLFGRYPFGVEYRNILHHVRLYNLGCIVAHLKEHNFIVLSAEGEKLLPQKFIKKEWSSRLSEFLARIFPNLCSNLIIVAQKPPLNSKLPAPLEINQGKRIFML